MKNNLFFGQPVPFEQIYEFGDHLNSAIDNFIEFISENGGLKKYISSTDRAQ